MRKRKKRILTPEQIAKNKVLQKRWHKSRTPEQKKELREKNRRYIASLTEEQRQKRLASQTRYNNKKKAEREKREAEAKAKLEAQILMGEPRFNPENTKIDNVVHFTWETHREKMVNQEQQSDGNKFKVQNLKDFRLANASTFLSQKEPLDLSYANVEPQNITIHSEDLIKQKNHQIINVNTCSFDLKTNKQAQKVESQLELQIDHGSINPISNPINSFESLNDSSYQSDSSFMTKSQVMTTLKSTNTINNIDSCTLCQPNLGQIPNFRPYVSTPWEYNWQQSYFAPNQAVSALIDAPGEQPLIPTSSNYSFYTSANTLHTSVSEQNNNTKPFKKRDFGSLIAPKKTSDTNFQTHNLSYFKLDKYEDISDDSQEECLAS